MNLSFLFWNTNGKKCVEEINNIVKNHDIDILILAENPASPSEILLKLNESSSDYYPNHPSSFCAKIKIYTKFHYNFISPIEESHRLTARKLSLPTISDINLVGLHLGDKGNFSSESQSEMATQLREQIILLEKNSGHSKTIIIGDFNMNPFELGMIKANGFHGTMSQKIAKQKKRKVQYIDYDYFYNPMWGLFGDLSRKTNGTYFYRRAELVNLEWNIFDQVLIRPSLIDNFEKKSLEIITNDGTKDLITRNGIPNKNLYSDHLPIKFKLILK
ncbi:hypothetical protein [Flavobacterium gelatinilyticum]|uniref:hypothetical protein n=1 Tax=Flavobacterium gelatinilyticum TaxID=3003260 RepID=UPI00248137F6|nr:hypothetical protein [Flavobacterium gelatinilyticum]